MLSSRGKAYAAADLMAGYTKPPPREYDAETNPDGEISFSNAENFLMHNEILDYINCHHNFTSQTITYHEGPVGTERLRKAMANHLNIHLHPHVPVTASQVTFTNGVTALNEIIALNLTDPGEGILLGRPIYGSFYGDLKTKSQCELIYASFESTDQFSPEVVAKYESALLQAEKSGIKTKALLICNPHNPLGRCYSVDALKALMKFCSKYGLHLISDEVYALSVFEIEGEQRTGFSSILSIDPEGLLNSENIHVLYGMSKDFGAAGLRLGCLVSQNEELNTATRSIGRFHWISGLSCEVATTILEDQSFVQEYTRKSVLALKENYLIVTRILDDAGIEYVRGGNAGFFVWIDLSPFMGSSANDDMGWEAEKDLKQRLADAGVTLSSGLGYKAESPGWFRVIFTVDRKILEEGLRRIVQIAKQSIK